MSAKKKAGRVKALRCWGYPAQIKDGSAWVTTKQQRDSQDAPLFLLPADAASYEKMVEQAHAAIASDPDYTGIAHHQYLDLVGTVLAAIGIKEPRK